MYSLIKTKLGPLSDKLEWLGLPHGSKLIGESADEWFEEITSFFGNIGILNGPGGPFFNLGPIPNTNNCIFTSLYPSSGTGHNWTIGFHSAPCNATSINTTTNAVWKIRFDND